MSSISHGVYSKPPSGTCFLTMTSKKYNSSLNVSKTFCKDSRVLDFGATDHTGLHSSLLTSYVSLFSNHISVFIVGCLDVLCLSIFIVSFMES